MLKNNFVYNALIFVTEKKMIFKESQNSLECFLKSRLNNSEFPESLRALEFAEEKHKGQLRKPKELGIPYITHPMTMASHALAMGINDDVLIAAVLLHDVAEDCGVQPENLPVGREAQEIVRLVTKPKNDFSENEYYDAIAENPKACFVKCVDRCNNVSGMALGFSPEKVRQYIEETETYYPKLLNVLKEIPEYSNAAWLLGYQIGSLLETAKKIC